jgi:hypothetical protein
MLDGRTPETLKCGTILPMFKDKSRYFPITLLELLYEAVTTPVSGRFYAMAVDLSILEPNHYAFRTGGTTAAPIDITTSVFQMKSLPTHAAASGASSAYGAVPIQLLGAIFSLGAPRKFCNWIMNTADVHTRLVSTPGGCSRDTISAW